MMWRRSCLDTEASSLLLSSLPAVTGAGFSAWGRKTLGGQGGPADDRDAPCLKTSSELVAREVLVGLATALAAASLTARGDQIQYLMPCMHCHVSPAHAACSSQSLHSLMACAQTQTQTQT